MQLMLLEIAMRLRLLVGWQSCACMGVMDVLVFVRGGCVDVTAMDAKLCGAQVHVQVHVQDEAAVKEAEATDPEDKSCRMFFCNVVAALHPSRLAMPTTKRMLL